MTGSENDYHFKFDDEYLMELGRITLNASYLEIVVTAVFWRLLGPDKDLGERLTADAGFRWLIDHTRAIAEYRLPDELRDEVTEWLTRADRAYSKRNRIVHSHWYAHAKRQGSLLGLGFIRMTAKGKRFRRDIEDIEPRDLREVGLELERVGLEGVNVMGPIIDLLGQFEEPKSGRDHA